MEEIENLTTIGSVVEVRPWDDICATYSAKHYETIVDRAPFSFKIAALLFENTEIKGFYGPVIASCGRYDGLVCSAIVRVDDPSWTRRSSTIALFKVGSTQVRRVPGFEIRHPDGTCIDSYPSYTSGGEVVVQNKLKPNESTAEDGP